MCVCARWIYCVEEVFWYPMAPLQGWLKNQPERVDQNRRLKRKPRYDATNDG